MGDCHSACPRCRTSCKRALGCDDTQAKAMEQWASMDIRRGDLAHRYRDRFCASLSIGMTAVTIDMTRFAACALGIAPNNCKTGLGGGITVGGDTALGLYKGTSGTASAGAGLFFGGSRPTAGGFASGGMASNLGSIHGLPGQTMGTPASIGGGLGPIGVGLFLTNASSASQLSGKFLTFGGAVAAGLGLSGQVSFGYDAAGNPIWQGSLTMGYGAGVYGYSLTTTSKTATTGTPCN